MTSGILGALAIEAIPSSASWVLGLDKTLYKDYGRSLKATFPGYFIATANARPF